jgi:dephospho-CoA kinase
MTNELKTQRIIGLTGGIATGKTTVTNYLQEKYNLPIVDADLLAREAVKKNSPILEQIFNRYGEKIKLPNGELNRGALGEIIFNNSTEKNWLESKIHPDVREKMVTIITQLQEPIIILDIPLLFEAKMTDLVTEIWVVSCREDQQKERLMKRNNLTPAEAETRIKNQLSLEFKLKYADIILDNSGTLKNLYNQIDKALSN